MKKAILFILISFVYMLICVFFSACEKTVNIDVPEKEPRLAVQAIFEEDEPFYAVVSRSRHILLPVNTGTGGGPMWRDYLVTNAVPVIYENGTPIETLVYDPSTETYISPGNKKARAGFSYSIRVTAPGFKEVDGQSTFPSASEILEVKWVKQARTNSDGSLVDDITIKFADPGGEKNFYQVQLQKEDGWRGSFQYISCISTTDKDIEILGGDDDPTETENCHDNSKLLMRDVNFNGSIKQLKISVWSNMLQEYTDQNGNVRRPYIKLYRITEDQFKYIKSMGIYENTNENPFAEPVNIYSNIKNGYGIFATYTMAVDTLR
jgi:hypothetical protein